MMDWKKSLVVAGALLYATAAWADKCKDPIVDEVNAFSGEERARVEGAIAALKAKGADARVHVLSSFHRCGEPMCRSLDEHQANMQSKCPSWQSADGAGMKNNLFVMMIVPKKKTDGVYYGDQFREALDGRADAIRQNTMLPRFREGKIADGVVAGLNDVVDLMSVKRSEATRPVVIQKAADYSGLWSFFKWVLAIGALALVLFGAVFGWRQVEKRRNAQRGAQTERGRCVQSINAFDGAFAVLKSKVSRAIAEGSLAGDWQKRVNQLLDEARSLHGEAAADYSGLNRAANNPDTPRLSEEEYNSMTVGYGEAAEKFALADAKLRNAEAAFGQAMRGDPYSTQPTHTSNARRAPETPNPSSASSRTGNRGDSRGRRGNFRSPPSSRPATPTRPRDSSSVGHTTHHGSGGSDFVTGVVVGEILGHHHHDHNDRWREERQKEPSKPVIVDPAPHERPSRNSEGGAAGGDWGKSSDGGKAGGDWGVSSSGGKAGGDWDDPTPTKTASPSWDSSTPSFGSKSY